MCQLHRLQVHIAKYAARNFHRPPPGWLTLPKSDLIGIQNVLNDPFGISFYTAKVPNISVTHQVEFVHRVNTNFWWDPIDQAAGQSKSKLIPPFVSEDAMNFTHNVFQFGKGFLIWDWAKISPGQISRSDIHPRALKSHVFLDQKKLKAKRFAERRLKIITPVAETLHRVAGKLSDSFITCPKKIKPAKCWQFVLQLS